MRYKVLTVDDSKTVRIIVKKAFKLYDCDILESANGVEGLAMAAKENPLFTGRKRSVCDMASI